MTNVTENYLEGIREGRSLLKAWQVEGPVDVPALARASIDTLDRVCRQFAAQSPVGQMLRGERDFWCNQLKKGA